MSSKRKYPNRPESEASIKAREKQEHDKKIMIIKIIAGILCAVCGLLLGMKLAGTI